MIDPHSLWFWLTIASEKNVMIDPLSFLAACIIVMGTLLQQTSSGQHFFASVQQVVWGVGIEEKIVSLFCGLLRWFWSGLRWAPDKIHNTTTFLRIISRISELLVIHELLSLLERRLNSIIYRCPKRAVIISKIECCGAKFHHENDLGKLSLSKK